MSSSSPPNTTHLITPLDGRVRRKTVGHRLVDGRQHRRVLALGRVVLSVVEAVRLEPVVLLEADVGLDLLAVDNLLVALDVVQRVWSRRKTFDDRLPWQELDSSVIGLLRFALLQPLLSGSEGLSKAVLGAAVAGLRTRPREMDAGDEEDGEQAETWNEATFISNSVGNKPSK